MCETTYIYSCAKTPVFFLTVEFCNWVCDRVSSGKVSSLLTYFTDYVKSHINNLNNRKPTGWKIIHIQRTNLRNYWVHSVSSF